MEVYLVRHTQVNVAKDICYGQSDLDLADTFKKEFHLIKAKLPENFDAVYSSPLKRCKQLALQFSKNIITSDDLVEMHFGDWEMQKWDKINRSDLDTWGNNFIHISPPNGENFISLYNRVTLFFEMLRQKNYNKVLVITHAGVIRCCWTYLLEIPLANIFKIRVNYGGILHFKLAKDRQFDLIKQFI